MYRIIKPRGGGKTEEILHLAEENNAIIICSNPHIYKKLAAQRGFNDAITFISYSDFLNNRYYYDKDQSFLIDEIDGLINRLSEGIIGYSLSPE